MKVHISRSKALVCQQENFLARQGDFPARRDFLARREVLITQNYESVAYIAFLARKYLV